MTDEMRALAMGVHVLDVLVRPVEAIPEGQGGELVEEIRITAAGSAGGTALTLAKLGARVAQRRRDRHATPPATCWWPCSSATASTPRCSCAATTCRRRPACCRSARTASGRPFTSSAPTAPTAPTTCRRTRSTAATHLHLGGPEFMGGEAAAPDPRARARARRRHLGRRARAGRARPARLDRARAARSSTTCCPTTSRCSRSPARTSSRPAAGRCSTAASAAWRPPAAPTASLLVDAEGAETGARLRGRGRRHHRLRRRVLGRLPARPLARARAAATPPCSAAPRRRSWRRGSAPTTATSTSPRSSSLRQPPGAVPCIRFATP